MQKNKEYYYSKYKGLIPKVIRDLNCQYRNKEEYQNYYDFGELGLLLGINKFDDSKEEKVSYFYKSIKSSILYYFSYKSIKLRQLNYIDLISLDQFIYEGNSNLSEIIQDENINIENDIIKNEIYESLHKAINTLKPVYQDIVYKYYGFNGKKYTLEELAQLYNVSKQAMLAKKKNILKKLKNKLMEYGVNKNDI